MSRRKLKQLARHVESYAFSTSGSEVVYAGLVLARAEEPQEYIDEWHDPNRAVINEGKLEHPTKCSDANLLDEWHRLNMPPASPIGAKARKSGIIHRNRKDDDDPLRPVSIRLNGGGPSVPYSKSFSEYASGHGSSNVSRHHVNVTDGTQEFRDHRAAEYVRQQFFRRATLLNDMRMYATKKGENKKVTGEVISYAEARAAQSEKILDREAIAAAEKMDVTGALPWEDEPPKDWGVVDKKKIEVTEVPQSRIEEAANDGSVHPEAASPVGMPPVDNTAEMVSTIKAAARYHYKQMVATRTGKLEHRSQYEYHRGAYRNKLNELAEVGSADRSGNCFWHYMFKRKLTALFNKTFSTRSCSKESEVVHVGETVTQHAATLDDHVGVWSWQALTRIYDKVVYSARSAKAEITSAVGAARVQVLGREYVTMSSGILVPADVVDNGSVLIA